MDLVADKVEEQAACGPILAMIRRLRAHVVVHARARGALSASHALFTGAWVGGGDALHYAPQRFLSHAQPAATV
jgi:thiamine pyrophosphate-dependent acetolactate synthase large subunit-like protein